MSNSTNIKELEDKREQLKQHLNNLKKKGHAIHQALEVELTRRNKIVNRVNYLRGDTEELVELNEHIDELRSKEDECITEILNCREEIFNVEQEMMEIQNQRIPS